MLTNPIKNSDAMILGDVCSEQDLLCLQDRFLTPGIHQLKANRAASARILINQVLSSLNYYQNIAGLSLAGLTEADQANHTKDLVQILLAEDYLVNKERLLFFFLENFYFDFLWIEETPQLLDCLWYSEFNQYLIDFNFHHAIPIIKISN